MTDNLLLQAEQHPGNESGPGRRIRIFDGCLYFADHVFDNGQNWKYAGYELSRPVYLNMSVTDMLIQQIRHTTKHTAFGERIYITSLMNGAPQYHN